MRSACFSVLLLLISVSLGSAFAAPVTVPADPWNPANPGDELNVYEIYNQLYGTSFGSSAELASEVVLNDEVFNFDGDIVVEARARYAGARQQFGYYQPTGNAGATLTELFDTTTPGIFLPDGPTVTINPVGEFGFYLDPEGPRTSGHTWFSEEALNSDGDHMIMYRTPFANTYLLAWADLPRRRTGVDADFDFNDFVIEISLGGGQVIPEPATLLLFGLGISTLAVSRLRRKLS